MLRLLKVSVLHTAAVGLMREEDRIEHSKFIKLVILHRGGQLDSRCVSKPKCLGHVGAD